MLRTINMRRGVRALALSTALVGVAVPLHAATAAVPRERHPTALSMTSGHLTATANRRGAQVTAAERTLFLFSRASAKPGERLSIQTQQRPEPEVGERARQGPIRLYLVPKATAASIRSRFDPRVFFIGAMTLDSRGRGALIFSVPPLESGPYLIAGWCARCPESNQPAFFVQAVNAEIPARYRRQALLRISSPDPARTCSVTLPNGSTPPGLRPLPNYHGNGMLWATLPGDGIYRGRPDTDGNFFEKILWYAAGTSGELRVTARRIDAPAPTPRTQPVPGSPPGFRGTGSWATRVWFTSEGCWKVTGRIRDVSLIFIARVVRAEGRPL